MTDPHNAAQAFVATQASRNENQRAAAPTPEITNKHRPRPLLTDLPPATIILPSMATLLSISQRLPLILTAGHRCSCCTPPSTIMIDFPKSPSLWAQESSGRRDETTSEDSSRQPRAHVPTLCRPKRKHDPFGARELGR